MKKLYSIFLALVCLTTNVTKAQYTTLFDFRPTKGTGSAPAGSLTLSGNVLYGMTQTGGQEGAYGTVFSINTDGSGYKQLHNFDDTLGAYPIGSLILSGNTLYGMTSRGGFRGNGFGNIFSIHTDGTGYKELLSFNGTTKGGNPNGDLVLVGSKLYGVSANGGKNNMGLVFCIDTDGAGFKDMLDFDGKNGAYCNGTLCNSGGVLYGMTFNGGVMEGGKDKKHKNGEDKPATGCIFSINADGSGYKDIYNFNDFAFSGAMPTNSLTISNGTIYGTREFGGLPGNGYGYIFSVTTTGTGFKDLHNFNDTIGNDPVGTLAISGNQLYGMTHDGGKYNFGIAFTININGEGYKSLYDFNANIGARPLGSLTLSGTTLYGMTQEGGKNVSGTIFSLGTKGQ